MTILHHKISFVILLSLLPIVFLKVSLTLCNYNIVILLPLSIFCDMSFVHSLWVHIQSLTFVFIMLMLPSKHNAMKLNFKSLEYHVSLQLFDLVITSVQRTLNLSLFNFANVVPIITYTIY